jgi:hypothetical protein
MRLFLNLAPSRTLLVIGVLAGWVLISSFMYSILYVSVKGRCTVWTLAPAAVNGTCVCGEREEALLQGPVSVAVGSQRSWRTSGGGHLSAYFMLQETLYVYIYIYINF